MQTLSKIVFAFILACWPIGVLAEESPVDNPPQGMQLYLLIGQSNMAGRGAIEETDRQTHPRVFMLNKDKRWVPAVDPLHFDKPIAGVSLGSTFGRVMADADERANIGLIPCAVGGTPLKRWQKGGDLYKQAVERTKVAQQQGTLKGILWHQGESDAGTLETAQSYGERLAEMIDDLRQELDAPDVPLVAGTLGDFLAEKKPDGQPSHWKLINKQIVALPKTVSHTAVADSAGLAPKDDQVHFDAAALREFGRRFAKALQQLQQPAR